MRVRGWGRGQEAMAADRDPKFQNSKFLQFLSKMTRGEVILEDNQARPRGGRAAPNFFPDTLLDLVQRIWAHVAGFAGLVGALDIWVQLLAARRNGRPFYAALPQSQW